MRRLSALLVLLVFSPTVMAWSALGHRMVGDIAQHHLQQATARAVRDLLDGEREPTLAGVANWADALRSSEPARFRQTSRWHYVNVSDATCRYRPARDCTDGQCVVGAIQSLRAILADRRQPRAARRDALKFLVHFVGDVHQPLHAGRRGDKGGNRFQVSLRTDLAPEAEYARDRYVDGVMGTNLHAVWDYDVLAASRLDARAYVRRLEARRWPALDGVRDPAAWAGESCHLSDAAGFYPATHVMDHHYLDAQRPLAEQRIHQAGLRLARMLDETLGSRATAR